MKTNLYNDFPSLRLVYEQIKDALAQQKEVARDYANRAITLFSVATAILGIGLPMFYTKQIFATYLINKWIPLSALSVIPILIYVQIILVSWQIWLMQPIITLDNPEKINDFLELDEAHFYSDMIQHTQKAFGKNKAVIQRKVQYLRQLVIWTIVETAVIVVLAFVIPPLVSR